MRSLLLALVMALGLSRPAWANPIAVHTTQYGSVDTDFILCIALILACGLAVEYLVFRLFTRSEGIPTSRAVNLFLLVHAVSLPLTFILSEMSPLLNFLVLGDGYRASLATDMVPGLLVQAAPISIEAVYYAKRLWQRGERPGTRRAWALSMCANAASYLVGLVTLAIVT